MFWLSSLGISALIGISLNLSARVGTAWPERWVSFRLFLTPFCVSSYSATIKGKGFILLFPSDLPTLLRGVGACVTIIAIWLFCRLISPRWPSKNLERMSAKS